MKRRQFLSAVAVGVPAALLAPGIPKEIVPVVHSSTVSNSVPGTEYEFMYVRHRIWRTERIIGPTIGEWSTPVLIHNPGEGYMGA